MTSKITRVEVRYVPDDKIDQVTAQAMLGLADGFLPAAQLELIDEPGFEHAKRDVDHPKNLETIYKAYQVVDGTDDERCAQLKVRSMTYGDAILFDGIAYYVAADGGFVTRTTKGELVPVAAP